MINTDVIHYQVYKLGILLPRRSRDKTVKDVLLNCQPSLQVTLTKLSSIEMLPIFLCHQMTDLLNRVPEKGDILLPIPWEQEVMEEII